MEGNLSENFMDIDLSAENYLAASEEKIRKLEYFIEWYSEKNEEKKGKIEELMMQKSELMSLFKAYQTDRSVFAYYENFSNLHAELTMRLCSLKSVLQVLPRHFSPVKTHVFPNSITKKAKLN